LKIAGISSTKAGDVNEGELKNRRQYQGAYSEYDEDIQWNDFALRNYDPQIARWVQQDPYQQFASPYVALGGDPVNMVDPSGGWAATGLFSGLGIGTRIGVTTLIGAIGGAIATAGSGNVKGLIVGAFLGLASNFIGSGWSVGLVVKSAVVSGTNFVVSNIMASVMPMASMSAGAQNVTSVFSSNGSYGKYGGNLHGGPSVDFDLFALIDDIQNIVLGQGGFQKLSNYEIELLKKAGWSHHDKQFGSKMDLYKDGDGDVYEADKEADKTSEYEPTGYNIKNGKVTITDFSKALDLPKSNAPSRDNAQPPKFYDPKKLKIKQGSYHPANFNTPIGIIPPITTTPLPVTVPSMPTMPVVEWPTLPSFFEPIFFP
jgi:RHS repeat-associated protein